MANCTTNINSSGETLYHLRRIGPPASRDGVVTVMDLYKSANMIGRNAARVDFYIDSSNHIQSQSLSRCHARIVRQSGNQYKIYDDSLNGVYVNNMKISASCILNEGDKVIFGHPSGARLPAGSRSRQPNSEHQFMFEVCSCTNQYVQRKEENKQTFKKPVSPRLCTPDGWHSMRNSSTSQQKNPDVKDTQNYTDNVDTNGPLFTNNDAERTNVKELLCQTDMEVSAIAPPIQKQSSLSESSSKDETSDRNFDAMDVSVQSGDQENVMEKQTALDDQSTKSAESGNQYNAVVKQTDLDVLTKESVQIYKNDGIIEKHSDLEVTCNEAYSAGCTDVNEQVITNVDLELAVNEVDNTEDCESPEESDQNISELEGTVNSILSDLCAMRGAVENGCIEGVSTVHSGQFKSPTKDVCIQTSQRDMHEILSPTKEMGIQTSQVVFDYNFDNSLSKAVAVIETENLSSNIDHVEAEVKSEDSCHGNKSKQSFDLDSTEKEKSVMFSQNKALDISEADDDQYGEEKPKEDNVRKVPSGEDEPNDIDEKIEITENCSQKCGENISPNVSNNQVDDQAVQQKVDNTKEFAYSDDEVECVLLPKFNIGSGPEVDKIKQLTSCIDSPHLSLSDSIAYDAEEECDAPDIVPSDSMEYNDDYCHDDSDEKDEFEEKYGEEIEEMNCENTEEDSSSEVNLSDNESANACPQENHEKMRLNTKDSAHINNEENSRKRKMSSEIIESDCEEDCARKRHCSGNVDVPDKDTALPDIEVDQQLSDSDSDEGQEAIASQKNLKKLKDGMKRFFTLWSENASSSSGPGSSEHLYLQDRSGKVEELHLDVPNVKQNVVDELGRLENRGTESAELDNGAETSQASASDRSDNFQVNESNTDSESESRGDEGFDKITSVSGDMEEDVVETYIKSSQLDEDSENDEEMETSLFSAVSTSPLKQTKVPDDLQRSSDSSMSPVVEKCGENPSAWLSTLPLQQFKQNLPDVAIQSGCEFSDDDGDFPSPENYFNYFNDNNEEDVLSNESSNDSSDVLEPKRNAVCNNSESDSWSDEGSVVEIVKKMEKTHTEGAGNDNIVTVDKESVELAESDLEELLSCEKQSNGQIKNVERSYNLDFDFCDSESDDVKSLDNGADLKESKLKRKSNSHSSDLLSKKARTGFQNEDHELSTNEGSETPFKTPADTQHRQAVSHQSPDVLSCTQLMESSQSPDLNSLTMTQISSIKEKLQFKVNDKSRMKDSRNKAKNLLEKLRARKRVKEEAANDSNDFNSSPAGMTDGIMQAESCIRASLTRGPDTQVALDDIKKHVHSCRRVIDQLKAMFERNVELQDNTRVQAWRKELSEVEKKLDFAKTVIAVVGDTGAGKSSLMNAVLDHRSVLPTSGIRACTAVVVEVVENTASNEFIADIQFLQRKEWFDELEILLNDLKGRDGTIKNRSPDPTSDAYVSYCKVKAVYGRVDYFNVLSRLTMVTHWLGNVKVIKSRNSEDFRKQVEKYIETQEPTGGGQYWPIVKHVTLKIPNCDVCSTGASLVDLPGVRDSNAARDKIAREYLKNCTAVWVVSSIHRAIDDKTAKDLLGENFRRQLLMDGQYGSIAFICTKTDVIIPSEIIRSLKLEGRTAELEEEIKSMESEKCELDLKIMRHPKEIQSLTTTLEETRKEEEELRGNLHELKSLLDTGKGDKDDSQSDEKEAIKEYEDELKQKEGEIETMETRLESLVEEKQFSSQKVLELEGRLTAKRKTIASMCARARNDYSKSQIRRDFKAGLKEMKRRAGMIEDNEEDIYSDDDEDDGDIGSSAENLKVFCCSSTEYQKMKNLLTDDGPPQVFSTLSDTQIPELRLYVHEMTSIRRKQSLERLIRNLGSLVFDMQTYILESGDTKFRNREFVKTVIDSKLENFNKSLVPVIQQLVSDIDDVFDGSIKQKVEQGASNAVSEANDTCSKWGAPVNRDKNTDKRLGGLHFQTYRATVRRLGVFKSPSCGNVDFNEDLAEPIYRSLTIVWDRAFSGLLWKILDKIQTNILRQIKQHCRQLREQLVQLGMPIDRIHRVSAQFEGSASNKLIEMVDQLKDTVTNRQRDISRLITPHIQASLTPVYESCSGESGPGMYMRIKTCISQGIDLKRRSMFDEATVKLMQALIDLQNEMVQYVRQVCQVIVGDLKAAFEPLWDAPGNSHVLKVAFMNQILAACSNVRQIYEGARLRNTEERSTSTTVESRASNTQDNRVQQEAPVRIKVEQTTSCLDRTMNTMPVVHTSSIKQEKNVLDQSTANLALPESIITQFGIQTLQDIQAGKLDISPVEVTVKSTPHPYISTKETAVPATSRTQVIVQSSPQQKVSPSEIKTLHIQNGIPTVQVSQTPSALSSSNLAAASQHQYRFLQTLPDGSSTVQPYSVQQLLSGQRKLLPAYTTAVVNQNVPMRSILRIGPNTSEVIDKENHSGMCRSSSQTNRLLTSSQSKATEKQGKMSLSLSQKNNSISTNTPSLPIIKTEPKDNGTYGRRRPKYLGTIDLTDD